MIIGEKGKKIKRIGLQDRQGIEKCIKDGMSSSGMSKVLGISKNAVNVEIRKAGGRGLYNAISAQKLSEERLAKRNYASSTRQYSMETFEDFKKLHREGVPFWTIRKRLNCGYIGLLKMYKEIGAAVPNTLGMIQEMNEKIYNIEQQLEVIFTLIGENK